MNHWNNIKEYAGVILIMLGTLTLATTRISSHASSNTLLVIGFMLVVAGIGVHIWSIKHESKY